MFDPIETGRETQWFHTHGVDTDPAPRQFDTEIEAIKAAIDRLSNHVNGMDRDTGEPVSIDWQSYRRDVIHEVVETTRGLTTSVTVTPLVKGISVRLTLLPPD